MQPSITMRNVDMNAAMGVIEFDARPIMRRDPTRMPYWRVGLPPAIQAAVNDVQARALGPGETEDDRRAEIQLLREQAVIEREFNLQSVVLNPVRAAADDVPAGLRTAIYAGVAPPDAMFDELQHAMGLAPAAGEFGVAIVGDRKSTRLNSSH